MRERYIAVMEELAPNGSVGAALEDWSDDSLRRIAQEIVGVYDQVTRHMEPLDD